MEADTALGDYGHGYSSPMATPFRTSDIDFRDVFGGPPRRSSIHEMMRYSFTEGADALSSGRRLGETPSFGDPWTVAEEKPVFGGRMEGGNRRRGLRKDFFVDIFGGSESPSSTTPRKHDRDLFSASPPGSRPLSPAWPLPPQAEGFVGPSSVPTQFSLPSKLSMSVDSPTFGSPKRTSYKDSASNVTSQLHSPKISVFGFTSRPVQVHDESRNDGTHYRPGPLSQQFSLGREDSFDSTKHEKSDDSEKDAGNSQDVTSSPKFHFSIYKWAGKGVPLIMPRRKAGWRKQEKGKIERSSFDGRTETSDEVENQPVTNSSLKVELKALRPVENEVIPSQKQEDTGSKWNNNFEDISAMSELNDKDGKSSGPTWSNSREGSEKELNGEMQKLSGPDLKPLHAFFHDKDEEQGNNEDAINRKSGGTSGTERGSKGSSKNDNNVKVSKKSDEELSVRRSEEATKVGTRGSPGSLEDGTEKKRSKGKVKEFIKIFSQEAPPAKPKASVHPQSQSFMGKEKGTPEATLEANIRKITMVTERTSVSQLEKPSYDSKKVADPHHEENSTRDNTDILFSDASSGQKDNSASSTASATDDTRVADEDADESCRAYFTIKELPQDENKQGRPAEGREEIQAIDAKVRQWSRGREGNIRSLLSTLQYVLWPGSGWKPVPLVDIIEGPAVKRAYQRALLCLHPDKLQQKGADPSQKYIAEKVFDMLQESWSHFNTVGAI